MRSHGFARKCCEFRAFSASGAILRGMNGKTVRIPAPLSPGDGIQLAAPARFVTAEQIDAAAEVIQSAGFEPVIPDGLLARDGQFGGDDAHRAHQLNSGFKHDRVRAIWAMRGGYGCGRVLPLLDRNAYVENPTWLIGFSDITALHAWSQNLGVASLHGPVANTFKNGTAHHQKRMWELLTASERPIGAPVVGGNLSVLYSLLGTPYFPDCRGAWLLIEDLDEYLYHIDRMMLAMRLAGVFEQAHGLMVGEFSDLHDNTIADGQQIDNPFGQSLPQIIANHWPAEKPVVWNVPVGHGAENEPVVLGVGTDRVSAWTERI